MWLQSVSDIHPVYALPLTTDFVSRENLYGFFTPLHFFLEIPNTTVLILIQMIDLFFLPYHILHSFLVGRYEWLYPFDFQPSVSLHLLSLIVCLSIKSRTSSDENSTRDEPGACQYLQQSLLSPVFYCSWNNSEILCYFILCPIFIFP